MHVRSALTVVTDDCHANSIFGTHVTVNGEWCQASRAIRINFVISAYADVFSGCRTGIRYGTALQAISDKTLVTLA